MTQRVLPNKDKSFFGEDAIFTWLYLDISPTGSLHGRAQIKFQKRTFLEKKRRRGRRGTERLPYENGIQLALAHTQRRCFVLARAHVAIARARF